MVISSNETCCCCFPIKTGLMILVILSIPELFWAIGSLTLVAGAHYAGVGSEVILYGIFNIFPSLLSCCLLISWACGDTEKTRKNLVCAFFLEIMCSFVAIVSNAIIFPPFVMASFSRFVWNIYFYTVAKRYYNLLSGQF